MFDGAHYETQDILLPTPGDVGSYAICASEAFPSVEHTCDTCFFSDVKKITCLTIQLTVGFLSPDNGGTEGGVKTIDYFMYVRPWFRVPVYVCPSVDYRLVFSSSFLLVFIKTRQPYFLIVT